jgi:hypothetical protein
MMTVAELIEELNKLPQDMLVLVPGYEGGYDNIEVQRNGTVVLDDNWDGQEKFYWYNGRHATYYKDMEGDEPASCVVIGRGK